MPLGTAGTFAPKPVEPVRGYSFTDWQVNNPTSPPPGDKLDGEIDKTNAALGDTLDWAATSLSSDGTLRPGTVGNPQFTPGLFDSIAADAVAEVQPLVDEAQSYATSALGSANTAASSAVQAGTSANQAASAATTAQTAVTTVQDAADSAQASADAAANSAYDADNSANHADGNAATAQAYADVGMAWAEHMPDIIPSNILAVQAVTGDHWSSRWWANRAAETLSEMESLLLTIPPLAVVYYYTYIALAGQTVFSGADRDGKVLTYTPGPQQTLMVFTNGVLRTPVNDYAGTANTVTFTTPRAAGDIVQIQVEGVGASGGAGSFLPLTGGTMLGPITLAADPAGPMQPVTRQYSDAKYLTFAGGTLTGPLLVPPGSVSTPSLALSTTPTTGLFFPGGTIHFAVAGADKFIIGTTDIRSAAPFRVTDGSVALPAFTFSAEASSGLTRTGAGQITMSVAGAARTTWSASAFTTTVPVVLPGDPTTSTQAATKHYVDNNPPFGGPYLTTSGGTITGNLTVSGTTMLAGFTASGAGTVAGLVTGGAFQVSGSAATFNSDANYTYLTQDGANWQWRYTRSNGTMEYVRGGDYTPLFSINGVGDVTVTGAMTSHNSLTIIGNTGNAANLWLSPATGQPAQIVSTRGGVVRWLMQPGDGAPADDFHIYRYNDAGTYIDVPLSISRATAAVTMTGGLTTGNLNTGGITASSLHTTGNTQVDGALTVNGAVAGASLGVTGNVSVGARLTVNDIMNNSGAFYVGGSTSYYLARASDGNWRFVEGGTPNLTIAPGGDVSVRGAVYSTYVQSSGQVVAGTSMQVDGVGTNWSYWGNTTDHIGFSWNSTNLDVYVNYTFIGTAPSDERLKTVTGPYARGLAEIRQIDPVLYRLKGNDRGIAPDPATQRELNAKPSIRDTGKIHVGFVAQHVEKMFPELVRRRAAVIDGEKLDDVRYVDDGPWLTFALINAIKELDARFTALEGAPPGWHEAEHPRDETGRFT